MSKTINNICVIMPVFVTVIIGLLLSSSYSSASSTSSTTANASVTVGSACTFSGTVSTAHNAEVPNGTNRTDIGSTVLNTICNDNGGFAIYAVGYSSSEYGNNTMINQADSTITFNTGTSTSGNNSNWSMKLTQVTTGTYATTIDNSFNAYHNVPATYTKVAHRDSVTDASSTNPAVGSSISLTYQTYISGTQAAGTYQGKVKFTMVHPASAEEPGPKTTQSGNICYYANGNDVVGTMGCQTIPDSGTTDDVSPTSAILLASNFSREGYGFAGWSTTYDYSDSTGFLGPQEYIEFEEGAYSSSNSGLSLYAHWVKSAGNIQNWSGCSSLQQGSVTALTDQRDNDTYAVAKLADGNCWMIENLRLDNTATHNSDGSLAQGYGTSATYGNYIGLADTETEFTTTHPLINSLYSEDGNNGTINIGNSNYPEYRIPRYNNLHTKTRAQNYPNKNRFENSSTVGGMYSYGNYYTWAAAIANTTPYNSESATDINNKTSDEINTSICPTGWRLPYGRWDGKGASSGGFSYLDVQLGGTGINSNSSSTPNGTEMSKIWRKYPNNFIMAGGYGISIARLIGASGFYWSSTAAASNASSSIWISASQVRPGTWATEKHSGASIRCLYLLQ